MATRSAKIDQKADLIWAIADKLTGVYKPHEYGDVILPLTVIRRFDCILSDTKDAVLQKYDEVKNLPMKDWIEDIVWEMNTDEEDTTSEVRSSSKDKRNKGFIAHIDKLRSYLDAPEEIHLGRKPEDLLETLVNMVLGSPAICIYRSNGRSTARATSLAKVFVNNFNLPESTAIIDLAYGRCRDDNSHWQNVLKYCKDGCFQAMIDEYIHMLKETAGFQSDGNQY